MPPTPESFVHDVDGNLTRDGQWNYTWNANNRLIEMKTRAVAYNAGAPRQKLEFAYDSQGRRFSKKIYDWDSASDSYLLTSNSLYLYDGWNLIAELKSIHSSPLTLHSSFVWGTDLSGSLQGAGGVGGLLMVTNETGSTAYPSYDGNGNVMGYYAADTGESVAEFEYGPFGELIRETYSSPTLSGVEESGLFNFRFSTKYEDTETGLLYYGYRYYNAETGRWLNRDPIEENGGFNLYGFVGNNGINFVDYLGFEKINFMFNAYIDGSLGLWLDEPGTVGYDFSTDNRGLGEFDSILENARIFSIGEIDTEKIGSIKAGVDLTVRTAAGQSHRRDRDTGAITSATTRVSRNVSFSNSKCSTTVKIKASGNYPFIRYSSDIDYDVTYKFTVVANGEIDVEVSGTHNKFPFYESEVDGSTFYYYFAPDSGPTLRNLGGTGGVSFNESGKIFAKTPCECDKP